MYCIEKWKNLLAHCPHVPEKQGPNCSCRKIDLSMQPVSPTFWVKHWFLNTWFLQPNTPDRNMCKSDNTCNKNWHTFKESSSWITIHGTTKTGLATPSHKKTSINSNTFQRITCKLLWLIKVGEVESLSMKMLQFWDLKFSN